MFRLSGQFETDRHHGLRTRYCTKTHSLQLKLLTRGLNSRTCLRLFSELNIGKKLNEGKTKQIFELVDQPGLVLVQSKDQITAGNAVRKDQMEGKAAIANKTTSSVFQLLQESGE